LFLYGLNTEEYGYTDTDSLFVKGHVYERLLVDSPHLFNETSEAPMGTYKNDHEGPGEIVIGSFLLAKKVKLHCTLDRNGVLRLHDTFKGYNPSTISPQGDTIDDEVLLFKKVQALGEIFFKGAIITKCTQTEFKRHISQGITIDKESKFSGAESTFYGHSAGSVIEREVYEEDEPEAQRFRTLPRNYYPQTFVERLIPHGLRRDVEAINEDDIFKGSTHTPARAAFYAELSTEWDHFLKHYGDLITKRLREEADENSVHYKKEEALAQKKWKDLFDAAPKLQEIDYVWDYSEEASDAN
jgi:hypothetical protein